MFPAVQCAIPDLLLTLPPEVDSAIALLTWRDQTLEARTNAGGTLQQFAHELLV